MPYDENRLDRWRLIRAMVPGLFIAPLLRLYNQLTDFPYVMIVAASASSYKGMEKLVKVGGVSLPLLMVFVPLLLKIVGLTSWIGVGAFSAGAVIIFIGDQLALRRSYVALHNSAG